MTCVHFGRDQICTQVKHLAIQPKSTQVEWWPLTYYQPMKYRICLPWNGFFATRVCLRGNLPVRLATQCKSLRNFNLHPLATTCWSFWPGLKLTVIKFLHGNSQSGYCRGFWCLVTLVQLQNQTVSIRVRISVSQWHTTTQGFTEYLLCGNCFDHQPYLAALKSSWGKLTLSV